MSPKTLFLVLFIAAVFVAGCFRISCFDIWWQLEAGQVIFSQGFPETNVFAHSQPDGAWETEEWLFEVLAEGWRRLFGLNGLVALRGLVLAAVYLFLFLAARRKGARTVPTLWILALSVLAGRERWFIRPQILTYLFAAVFLFLAAGRRRRFDYILYPVLMVLWVNSHPAFVLGIVILGASLLSSLAAKDERTRRILGGTLAIISLCLAATLVNPHGWKVYHYVLSVSQSAQVKGGIAEWGHTNWAELTLYAKILALLCIAALVLPLFHRLANRLKVTTPPPDRRHSVTLGDYALVLFSLVLFFTARRHLELLALLPIPSLASALCSLSTKRGESIPRSVGAVVGFLPVLFIIVTTFTWERPWGFSPDWRNYPRGGTQYIRDNNISPHLFNSYRYGGFVLYELFPDYRVFIDGRPYVYSNEIFEDYGTVLNALPGWEQVLNRYEVNSVFLAYEPGWGASEAGSLPHALHRSPEWALVFWDDTCMVYVRRTEAHRQIISNDEYRIVIPSDEDAAWLPMDTTGQLRALDEIDRKIDDDPRCTRAHRIRGTILSRMRRDREAEEAFQNALAIDPTDSVSHNALGVFYAERRRWAEAEREFRAAVRLASLDTASRVNLARVYIETGNIDRARRLLKEVLKLDPHYGPASVLMKSISERQ